LKERKQPGISLAYTVLWQQGQISGDSEEDRSILLERTFWFPSRFTKADKAFTNTLSPDVLKEEFVCSVGMALNE
jgi:hypothetical protein